MFFLLAVWSLSLAIWFFQGILHNHMGRRKRGEGEQTDICALLHPVWLQHFREKKQKNWKHSSNQIKRHPGTSVVTSYPGKYPYARQSLVHRRNSGHWKSQAGYKQQEPLKTFIKAQEGYIQFYSWHFTTKIKACKLFHWYYYLLVTEYALTWGEHKTTHLEPTVLQVTELSHQS